MNSVCNDRPTVHDYIQLWEVYTCNILLCAVIRTQGSQLTGDCVCYELYAVALAGNGVIKRL